MSLATVSLATSSLRTMSLGTIVPRYNFTRNNVPHDNCSSRQLFYATIVPLDNCSWQQLFLRSFTNGHLQRGRSSGWPKSRGRRSTDCCKWSSGWFGLLRSFANGRLQRGLSFRWPKSKGWRSTDGCKWPSGCSVLLHPPPFLCKWSFAKRTVLRMTKLFLVGRGWTSRKADCSIFTLSVGRLVGRSTSPLIFQYIEA